MINPQLNGVTCPGQASGCLFLDMSELEVYGLAADSASFTGGGPGTFPRGLGRSRHRGV